jgi:DNA-binding NarL/FixJ family response regulator
VIRIVIVDDHPALRAGLQTVLRAEPGLVLAGEAAGEDDLWPLLHRARPDLVLLDYHLEGLDGLQLCYAIKRQVLAPRVLLYSAYASPALAIPAVLAGADGLVSKALAARELFDAIRGVVRGEPYLPPVSREMLDEAYRRVDTEEAPLLGMLLDGTPVAEVAETVGVDPEQVHRRTVRMLQDLRVHVPETAVR